MKSISKSCSARGMAIVMLSLVTPVRADFFANRDGTITDSVTNLVWDQCALGQSTIIGPPSSCVGTGTKLNWSQALKQVGTLNGLNGGSGYKGYSDWRIPSRIELESLVDRARANPSIDTVFFPNTPNGAAGRFWSSTSYSPNPSKTWGVDFSAGNSLTYEMSSVNFIRVVRGGGYSGFDAENPKSLQAPLVVNANPASILSGGSGAALSVSGGSTNGAVSYKASGSSGLTCLIANNLLTATGGPGKCFVTGSMAGDDTYLSVTSPVLTVPVTGGVLTGLAAQGYVGIDNQVQFGAFTIQGDSRRVLIRGLGPALDGYVPGAIRDPQIALSLNGAPTPIETNDDWANAGNVDEIVALNHQPKNPTESVILRTLEPGIYNVHLSGSGGSTGIGMFQVYAVDGGGNGDLRGLAAQGQVGTGNLVQFGTFTITGAPRKVLIRGLGPALNDYVPGALSDPQIALSLNGAPSPIETNDNWADAANAAEIAALNHQPKNPTESAILRTLDPGIYNVHLSGAGGTEGIGMFQVYTVE